MQRLERLRKKCFLPQSDRSGLAISLGFSDCAGERRNGEKRSDNHRWEQPFEPTQE